MNDPAMVEALLARVPGAGRAFIARHDAFRAQDRPVAHRRRQPRSSMT